MSIISLKQALFYGINKLEQSDINSARLDAEILLGFVLGFNREKLIQNQELRVKNQEWNRFRELIKKRSKHYPIAYLTGSKEFYGIDFIVNKNVLVPRPETEILIENVLHFVGNRHACSLLEIGTGSGCISLTLAKHLPKARITAVDVSEKALAVARKNRSKLGVKNVVFGKSDLLSNIKTKPDILVANLPYLTRAELKEPSIAQEPHLALYGGKDGLDMYKRLFQQIKEKSIRKNSWKICDDSQLTIFIEIGETHAKPLKKYILDLFPEAKIEIKKDLAGRDRVLMIRI